MVKTFELCPRGFTCSGQSPSYLSVMPHMPSISKFLDYIWDLTTLATSLPSKSKPLPSVAIIVIAFNWSLPGLAPLLSALFSVARMLFFCSQILPVASHHMENESYTPCHGYSYLVLRSLTASQLPLSLFSSFPLPAVSLRG